MYSRRLAGQTLVFGHGETVYQDSFLMYDTETESTWIHATGEAIEGRLKGRRLEFLPSVLTTWGAWRKTHPQTLVVRNRWSKKFGYRALEKQPIELLGISVGQADQVKLYPLDQLSKSLIVNDVFQGMPIVVVYDPVTKTGMAFQRGDREFQPGTEGMVDESGEIWDRLLGTSSAGESLVQIPATQWLIQQWRVFYPDSQVYSP